MLLLPSLEEIWSQTVTSQPQYTYRHKTGSDMEWKGPFSAPFSEVGKAKLVLGNKTKNFIPGKTWEFNPWDIRCAETKVKNSSGFINHTGYVQPVREWTGNLSQYLTDDEEVRIITPNQYTGSDDDVYRCLLHSYEKINSADVDYGMMLAEATETLSMLLNPLAAIRKLIRRQAPRKSSFKDVASALSGSWLEARYGWNPALSDLNAILNDVQSFRRKGVNYRASSKIEIPLQEETRTTDWGYTHDWYIEIKGVITKTTKLRLTSHVLWTPTLDFQLSGTEAESIPSVILEKIPFSFVADWFVNISGWLKAIQANPWLLVHGNTVFVHRVRTVHKQVFWATCNRAYNSEVTNVWNDDHKSSEFTGYRHVNVPLPWLPVVNVDLSRIVRKIDGISLIWQQIASSLNGRRVR